jgi:hypothetical protein
MLDENLRQLFAFVAVGPEQPPTPKSILIAELKQEDFEGSRPRIRDEKLQTPSEYEPRFRQLMEMGFAWVNMNYCGVFRGSGLVLIEYPRDVARAKGATSVNFSGPNRLVADAGWDALAYVILV